jgi:cell division control protein 6
MQFTFTGDPAAIMDRIVEDTRLKAIDTQEEILRSVVNAQLNEFNEY